MHWKQTSDFVQYILMIFMTLFTFARSIAFYYSNGVQRAAINQKV